MTDSMRAVVIDDVGGPDVLRLTEIDPPDRIGSEFLVKVVAAGVNPIDAKTRAGEGVASAIRTYPIVLGQDFSGIVLEAPDHAHHLEEGDEVYGMVVVPRYPGTYAERVSVPSIGLTRKPSTLSHVEAAGVPVAALTAWGAVVETAKAHQGQRILIHGGGGGVGHFAVQFAAYFGAHVIATGSTHSLSWLDSLGAAEVIDYTACRFEDVVGDIDVVIDLIGDVLDDTGTRSLRVLRPGGLLVNVPSGSWPTLDADAAAAGVRATTYRVSADGQALAMVSKLLESGNVRVFVDRVLDLGEAADAHRLIEEGHTHGKIVLKVCDG